MCTCIISRRSNALLLALFLLLSWCGSTTAGAADTRYAKPGLTIPMRQEARNAAEVKAYLPMDVQVTLLRQDRDWARIRLANSTEGWVRLRDLGEKPILPLGLLRPKEGERTDIPPIQNIQSQFKQLEGENKRLHQELGTCTTELKGLRNTYEALIADPDGIHQIKENLADAQSQTEGLQKKLETSLIENEVLKKNETIKWFLGGSGVLLLGWLIGRLTATSQKKKASFL